MAKQKCGSENNVVQYANAPVRILTRARNLYASALCNCHSKRSSVINCTVSRKPPPELTKKIEDGGMGKGVDRGEDLQSLMRLLSARNGGGAKVDVDSEGNLVWRKQAAAAASYGGGVGRIGRIDEDKACSFEEIDVNKLRFYSRCGSNSIIINSRNIVGCQTYHHVN